ncbi:hypothetical protein M011DRAFT_139734 [Sporormia fimetaria CBS 119925]|uniref:Uncharacterized protein n=1 Tax=Sporormia fimetaria CBS 119925 TaxID=1340428 RepID=A0A6A6V7R0_9PLEO|nr:hypothetical protein M011DRAFT_139734 [Sporormia fimetaria CBS 119925]
MGNLCGKPSKDNFDGPGRVVGSAPQPSANAKASVPAHVSKPKVGGPPRTLGGNGAAGESASNDPRSAAAAAAEARANKAAKGDLAKKLEAQRRQTRNQTLQSAAAENVAQRNADAATETRNYN